MKRVEHFEAQLDKLLKEYTDLSYEEIADSLEYYGDMYRRKIGRQ